MNKNEKDMDHLLHAIEHPEEYSDGQIEEMMSDRDNRNTYNLMVDAENAYRKDDLSDESLNAEWHRILERKAKIHRRSLLRIVAAVIGFIMISGIVYATITIGIRHREEQKPQAVKQAIAQPTRNSKEIPTDTATIAKPEIKEYRDAKLETVVGEIAAYYNKKVSFVGEKQKTIRIFVKWNQAETLEETVDRLNHFEKFSIGVEDDKIVVR